MDRRGRTHHRFCRARFAFSTASMVDYKMNMHKTASYGHGFVLQTDETAGRGGPLNRQIPRRLTTRVSSSNISSIECKFKVKYRT